MRTRIFRNSYDSLKILSRTFSRRYASASTALPVQAHELDRILGAPPPDVHHLTLITSNTWPKWEDISRDPERDEFEERCKSELPPILRALSQAASITKTTIALSDVMNLPIAATKQNASDTPARRTERTPVSIFEALDISCTSNDVGLWTLDEHPKIEISDALTRSGLLKAREVRGDNGDTGKSVWHDFVASGHNSIYQAYDFTADFHSRDLTSAKHFEGVKSWIDLSPFGQGYARLEGEDMDGLSVNFAQDLAENVEYFKSNPWRPGIYEEIRKSGDFVSSVLGQPGLQSYTTVVLDRPASELGQPLIESLIKKLNVGDDEEVHIEGKEIKKRKKNQSE